MNIENLIKRKQQLVDELILEIDGCIRRFHEDTGVGVSSINVGLVDVSPLDPSRTPVHVVHGVDVEVDI